jgi:hypothetical protein
MLEGSDDVIRMIAREAIESLQFNRSLNEASARKTNVVDTDILGRLVRGERESDDLVKARSRDVAAILAIASFNISQQDSNAFKKEKSWKHITDVVYEHEDSIDLLSYVKSLQGFAKISESVKGGVRILSLGEIYDNIVTDSEAKRIKKFSDLMRVKIACIIRVIQTLTKYTERFNFEVSLDKLYTKAAEVNSTVTPEMLSELKKDSEVDVNSSLIGCEEALSKLANIKNSLENWAVAELASEGRIFVDDKVIDVESPDKARDHLVKNNQGAVLSKLSSIYSMGEFNPNQNQADLDKGPMHIAVVQGTNNLLNMMGLGIVRGEKGKGVTGYKVLPNGQIASIAGLPIDYIEELGITVALEKVDQEVRERRRDPTNERIKSILRKYGSQKGSLRDAESSARDSPENQASRANAGSLGLGREDSLGGKAKSYESKIEEEKFIAPLRRIALGIDKHRYAMFPSKNQPSKWVALAFSVFAGPIAKAITAARFSDMSALANLNSQASVTAGDIASASRGRRSADELKRLQFSGPETSLSVESGATGDYTLDRLLACFTHSKFGDLQFFLDGQKPALATSKDTGVSNAVFGAVKAAAERARGAPQNDIIGAKILSGGGIYSDLAEVIEPIASNAGIVSAISGAYAAMGGRLGDLIRDIANGNVNDNIMEYIAGSCLEPIRVNDIEAMQETIDHTHNEETLKARDEKPTRASSTSRNARPETLTVREPQEEPQEEPRFDDGAFDDDLSESRLLEALHRVLMRKASAGQPRA